MNNAWNIKGDAQTYQKYDKGWKDEEKPKPVLRNPPAPVQRSGQSSRDNPLVNTHDYYKPSTNAGRGNMSKAMHEGPPMKQEEKIEQSKQLL